MTDQQVRRLRLRSQRLAGEPAGGVPEAVRAVVGLPAQDTRASRLAVRPRGAGLTAAAVRRACDQERSVVRTWAMRGTLHVVAAEDVGWLLALLGPVFAAAGRRRRLQLGLDDATSERGLAAIAEVLAGDRQLTRAELVREVVARGVAVAVAGQAPAHLLAHAARLGLVCRGPDLGEEPSYVLLAEWLGEQPAPPPEPDAALAELARRYLGGHGPAGADDLAAWSGLPLGRARRGLELVAGELEEVRAAGKQAFVLAGSGADLPALAAGRPPLRLLGHFDPYLLGWRGRELVLPARHARRIQAGGGMIQPALLVDGRVAGTWRQRRAGAGRLSVAVRPFGRLDRALLPALEAEAADVGRFLGVEADLAVEGG
ncbi:MAG TPA: winged helix DNA-binding domain-containing protein [Actinomycetes bacterium]|nr:winged helix DNA-binding domain-containing protein [Actinomycetes bacterium]